LSDDGATATGKADNISDGGVLVTLSQQSPPADGSWVGVHLRVPRTTPNTYMLEEFTTRARVIRRQVVPDGAAAAVGLEFARPLELALEV
jgi:hypothetical protein